MKAVEIATVTDRFGSLKVRPHSFRQEIRLLKYTESRLRQRGDRTWKSVAG